MAVVIAPKPELPACAGNGALAAGNRDVEIVIRPKAATHAVGLVSVLVAA